MRYLFNYLGLAGLRLILLFGVLMGTAGVATIALPEQAQAQQRVTQINYFPRNAGSAAIRVDDGSGNNVIPTNLGLGTLMRPFGNRAHVYRIQVNHNNNVTADDIDMTVTRETTTQDSSIPANTIVFTTDQYKVTVVCSANCVGLDNIMTTVSFFGANINVDVGGFRATDTTNNNLGAIQVGGIFAIVIEDGASPFTGGSISARPLNLLGGSNDGSKTGRAAFVNINSMGMVGDDPVTIPTNQDPSAGVIAFDDTPPSFTFAGVADNMAGTITWTITFSEPVNNVTLDKFALDTVSGTLPTAITTGAGASFMPDEFHMTYQFIATYNFQQNGNAMIRFQPEGGSGSPVTDRNGNFADDAGAGVSQPDPNANTFFGPDAGVAINPPRPDFEMLTISALDSNGMPITNGGAGTLAMPFNNRARSYQFAIKYSANTLNPDAFSNVVSTDSDNRTLNSSSSEYSIDIVCLPDPCAGAAATATTGLEVSATQDANDPTIHNISLGGFYATGNMLQVGGIAAVTLEAESGSPDATAINALPVAMRTFYFNRDTTDANGGGEALEDDHFDFTPPTITSIVGTAMSGGRISWVITFDEPVQFVDGSDFVVSPANMGGTVVETADMESGAGNTVTMESTHTMSGTFTLIVNGSDPNNVIGNAAFISDRSPSQNRLAQADFNIMSNSVRVTVDNRPAPPPPPAPTLRSITATQGDTSRVVMWNVTFSQNVTGFTMEHLETNFAADSSATTTISSFAPENSNGENDTYTFTTTTSGDEFGELTISLASTATAIMNTADTPIALVLNNVMGRVQLVQPTASHRIEIINTQDTANNELRWTFTFTEPVNAFTITVDGTDVMPAVTTDNTMPMANDNMDVYTFTTTTPAMANDERTIGRLEITLGDITTVTGAVPVALQNPYTRTVGGRSPEQVVALVNENIQQPMQQQAMQYLAAIPNLSNRLNRSGRSATSRSFTASNDNMHFTMQGNGGNFQYQKSGSGTTMSYTNDNLGGYDEVELWVDTSYVEGEGTGRKSEALYAYVGADFKVDENMVMGMLMQIDQTTHKNSITNDPDGTATSELSTEGIMFGPYIVGHIESYNLDVESHLSYGTSSVDFKYISENLDNLASEIQTSRLLFASSISRDIDSSKSYILTPRLEYIYFKETQDAFQLGDTTVAQKELEVNRLGISLGAKTEIKRQNYTLTPNLTLTGAFDNTQGEETNTTTIKGNINFQKGTINYYIGGHYDIITESNNLETFGINGGLAIKF